MKLILSPTKTMIGEPTGIGGKLGIPFFEQNARALNRQLAKLSELEIRSLFKTGDALTQKTLEQIRIFKTASPAPALFAFRGEAFKTLNSDSFSAEDLAFAQTHLRILSGLYGILSPMDGIRPYRLDAATPLKQGKKSLRMFWKEKLGPWFLDFLAPDEVLLNLASEEYASLLRVPGLAERTITLQFREQDGKKLKNIPVRAKQARGIFARAVILNRIQTPSNLKTLSPDGYVYSERHSNALEWFFIRGADTVD